MDQGTEQGFMSPAQLACHYGRALYEVARDQGEVESLKSDLQRLSFILASVPGVADFCRVPPPERSADLEARFCAAAFYPYLGKRLNACVAILVGNRRLAVLPLLEAGFLRMADADSGTTVIELESCHEASDELKSIITDAMTRRCGGQVRLQCSVHPALRGGFRLLWKNRIIDASLTGRIKALRKALTSV